MDSDTMPRSLILQHVLNENVCFCEKSTKNILVCAVFFLFYLEKRYHE